MKVYKCTECGFVFDAVEIIRHIHDSIENVEDYDLTDIKEDIDEPFCFECHGQNLSITEVE